MDASEGLGPLRKYPPETPNLIQTADYDVALKATFKINERNVSPVMHDEIVPVCIVEDLRKTVHPGIKRTLGGGRNPGGLAGNNAMQYVRCAPSGPTVLAGAGFEAARLIVDKIDVTCSSGQDLLFCPQVHYLDMFSVPGNIAGEETSPITSPWARFRRIPPNVQEVPTSGFTATLIDNTPFGSPDGARTFRCAAGQTITLEGPFELSADYLCLVMTAGQGAAALPLYCLFYCSEFPA